MIIWKDFILDDIVGPVLALPEDLPQTGGCSGKQLGSPDTRNGASGKQRASHDAKIQETRQEQRPARMVGPSSHDSAQVDRKSAGSDRANEPHTRLIGGEG